MPPPRVQRRSGWRPAQMFSATERLPQQIHLLVDGADAEALRILRGQRADRLAREQFDAAGCGRADAGQHLDQCRLAGAVLAHERVHFARAQREVHAGERLLARVGVDDAARLQTHRRYSAQYLRVWMYLRRRFHGNMDSSTTMRFGIGWPATTSSTEVMSCGPSSGLHSMVALSLPAIMASNAPFTPSMDTMGMSRAGLETGFLDGLDGADRHVVVVREQHVDLARLGLEEGLHDFLALGAREVTGLRADDFQARVRRR